MKIKFFKVGIALMLFFSLVCFMSFELIGGWNIPPSAAAKKNPVKSDASSKANGKAEYLKSCKMCHGAAGTGNGKMAGGSNLTSKEFKGLSDGAIFYQINTGKGRMPSYKSKITADNSKWNLVNYLRTL
ncbi:MAG: cytochrome c [Bacteroidetes bacterium]|nr:cytochrome c [Bacteroidota bacterium]